MSKKPRFTIIFFQELSGKEPVRDWINDLDKIDKKIIGHDIMVLQFRWPLGMPLVKGLNKGLWELRSSLTNRIARIIFAQKKDTIILPHAFIKKTQKTPSNEMEIAHKRLKEVSY